MRLQFRCVCAPSPQAKPKKKDGNGEFGSVLQEAAPAYKAGREKITANLSPAARAYLANLGIKNPDADADTAALIWMHALAIGYSPAYLARECGWHPAGLAAHPAARFQGGLARLRRIGQTSRRVAGHGNAG